MVCGLVPIPELQRMKNTRVIRTKADLLLGLQEQVTLLSHACKSYDNGLTPIGKHIALSLRVLLHRHANSQALLQQLGIRSKHFLDTAGDIDPHNVLTDNLLSVFRVDRGKIDWAPKFVQGKGFERWITFAEWWNNNVIKDDKKRFFNRRDLILNVADTDGGAHVDPKLDEAYMDLSRNNSLGWIIGEGDVQRPFDPPVMSCIRQIAHEVLETLKVKAKIEVTVDYSV